MSNSKENSKKSKVVLIILVAAGCLLLIAVATTVLPGVFCYNKVKKECDKINYFTQPYPYENTTIPEDFYQIEVGDLAISIPEELKRDNEVMGAKYTNSSGSDVVYVTVNEALTFEFDEIDQTIDKESWARFYQRLGVEIPQTHYELISACYALDMDDFYLYGKQMKQFAIMAQMKQTYVLLYQNVYFYETEDYEGFVYRIKEPNGSGQDSYSWLVALWPKSDNNAEEINVWVSLPDLDDVKAVISSIHPKEVEDYGPYFNYDWVNSTDGLISLDSADRNGPYFFLSVVDLNMDKVPEVIMSQNYSNRTAQVNDIYSIVNDEVVYITSFYGEFDGTTNLYEDMDTHRYYFACGGNIFQNQVQTDSVIVCSYNEDFTGFSCEPILSKNTMGEVVTYRQYRKQDGAQNCVEFMSVWDFGENEEATDVITEEQYKESYQATFDNFDVISQFPELHTEDYVYNIFSSDEYDNKLYTDSETISTDLETMLNVYLNSDSK